jgi:hypothetical protein
MNMLIVDESAKSTDIADALSLHLSFARGFCDMVATHKTIVGLAETSGVSDSAYGHSTLLDQAAEMLRVLHARLIKLEAEEVSHG